MDKQKFATALKALFLSKMKSCSAEDTKVWYDLLKDYPEEKVLKALYTLARDTSEFVNVGKVIELVNGSVASRANDSWIKIFSSACNGGRDNLSDLEIKALNHAGGMKILRDTIESQVPWIKKDFLEAYKGLEKKEEVDHAKIEGFALGQLQS